MEPKQPFPYDLFSFMSAVKDRPVIWDKTCESYNNKLLRRQAWHEVCAALDPDYADMSAELKARTVGLLTSKWANIRDAFLRSLRLQQQGHRPYIYYDQLKFMVKEDCDEDNVFEEEPSDLPELTEAIEDPLSTKVEKTSKWRRRHLKRKSISSRKVNTMDQDDDTGSSTSQQLYRPDVDEDMAFFQSLLTPVKSLTMSEKMEFRIGVLTMLQHFGRKDEESVEDDEQYFGKEI